MPDQREPMTTPATPAPMTAEAVEAAAKVHHRLHCNGRLPDGSQPCDREPREQDKATARQMLEAAAPVLAAAERARLQPELDRIEHDAIARYEDFAKARHAEVAEAVAAERERCVQLAHEYRAVYVTGNVIEGLETHPFADLLRQDGGT